MNRPSIVHLVAVQTTQALTIKASVTLISPKNYKRIIPIYSIGLLISHQFKVKIITYDNNHKKLNQEILETDFFGYFELIISKNESSRQIDSFEIFEISHFPNLEIFMGEFHPLTFTNKKNIVICDFDKTLVDTRYSGPKEIIESLTNPSQHFPTIEKSINLLNKYIDKEFRPFILSASPNFYESSIRNWLVQNNLSNAIIILKDVRQILSIFHGYLIPKDIKATGLYKINQLLNILFMVGIPDKLTLIGDNFEYDPIIYMALAKILQDDTDPWAIWNNLKFNKAFRLNNKQSALLLNKLHRLRGMILERRKFLINKNTDIKITINILIRRHSVEKEIKNSHDILKNKLDLITLF